MKSLRRRKNVFRIVAEPYFPAQYLIHQGNKGAGPSVGFPQPCQGADKLLPFFSQSSCEVQTAVKLQASFL
ncbi:hypothetical protein D3H55_08740 [Bacillus salacetis]|uniref:Uncharacterized protein n=1 Tax=Bacillus salacetis TaxID=2315464 RepID=A0A3A1R097_9BACI|nr:hypothetical protein D3H55_08740 [Bacillus salacetis]